MLRGWGWGGTFHPTPCHAASAPGGPAGGGLGVAFALAPGGLTRLAGQFSVG